jgi:predicted nucleotidyltransferase
MQFQPIYTITEAADLWGLDTSTIRKAAIAGKFPVGEAWKSGSTWLVTRQGMIAIFGDTKKIKYI